MYYNIIYYLVCCLLNRYLVLQVVQKHNKKLQIQKDNKIRRNLFVVLLI